MLSFAHRCFLRFYDQNSTGLFLRRRATSMLITLLGVPGRIAALLPSSSQRSITIFLAMPFMIDSSSVTIVVLPGLRGAIFPCRHVGYNVSISRQVGLGGANALPYRARR